MGSGSEFSNLAKCLLVGKLGRKGKSERFGERNVAVGYRVPVEKNLKAGKGMQGRQQGLGKE